MDSIYSENYIPGSGGSHWFTNHYNTALAMSEGYATYHSCVSRGDHWYDDKDPGNYIHWDCELNWDGYGSSNGNVDGLGYGYDTESCVLAILLDLVDSNNSPSDAYDWSSANQGVIYDVMRNYLPSGHHPYSIQEIYDGWNSRGWGIHAQLNGQMQVHGMDQGKDHPTIGISAGMYRYSGTWYWNGYGRASYDVFNYGSQPYKANGFYAWLRYPDNSDALGLDADWDSTPIASGATRSEWLTQAHTANSKNVKGTYSLTAGHWRTVDGAWMVLDDGENGVTNYLTVPVVADTTPPNFCTVTDDGDWQSNQTALHFNVVADDYDSAIQGYWIELGTSQGSGNVVGWSWHDAYNQTSWDYTFTGLSLSPNVRYYATVVPRNVEGYVSPDLYAYSDGIFCGDATYPGTVTVTDDGAYTLDGTKLHFKATSSEDTYLAGYYTRIGTSSGAGDIEDWKYYTTGDVDTFEHTTTGLALVHGTKYYVTVVANNVYGMNTWGYSDGIFYYEHATLTGHVNLLDFGASPLGQVVEIQVRDYGSTTPAETFKRKLDASGNWSVNTHHGGLSTVAVKGTHWLRQSLSGTINYPTTTGVNTSLRNGDVDGDNAVTVFDYNLLSEAFDSSVGDRNWNPDADLDGDGSVTVFDYNILSSNFDLSGNP